MFAWLLNGQSCTSWLLQAGALAFKDLGIANRASGSAKDALIQSLSKARASVATQATERSLVPHCWHWR